MRVLAHDAGSNVVMFRLPDRDDASFEADASQILGDLLAQTATRILTASRATAAYACAKYPRNISVVVFAT